MKTEPPSSASIAKSLQTSSESSGTAFMLITKDGGANSPLRISNSPHFSQQQRDQVYHILENSEHFNSIAVIKPVLSPIDLKFRNSHNVIKHYTRLFTCISQAICKGVAKEWIKIAEPRKQALFPYKNANDTKPLWWPRNVDHIEPDHLDKGGRITVLVSILRNPKFSLEKMKLKTAMHYPDFPLVLRLLDEIYYVAYYDRLFHSKYKEEDPSYESFSNEDRKLLEGNNLLLKVSEFRTTTRHGANAGCLMVSQIHTRDLNKVVFNLKGEAVSQGETNHGEYDSSHESVDIEGSQSDVDEAEDMHIKQEDESPFPVTFSPSPIQPSETGQTFKSPTSPIAASSSLARSTRRKRAFTKFRIDSLDKRIKVAGGAPELPHTPPLVSTQPDRFISPSYNILKQELYDHDPSTSAMTSQVEGVHEMVLNTSPVSQFYEEESDTQNELVLSRHIVSEHEGASASNAIQSRCRTPQDLPSLSELIPDNSHGPNADIFSSPGKVHTEPSLYILGGFEAPPDLGEDYGDL